jgi:hypothetical protein
MPDALDEILVRVAAGELSPEDADRLIAALHEHVHAAPSASPPDPTRTASESTVERSRRIIRLQVTEDGRSVVNLAVPVSWASVAGSVLPGLSSENAERLSEAIRAGTIGRILEVRDEDGDGVVISTE